MKFYEINGFYGSGRTPCTVYVAENYNGLRWYAVEDSHNVNATYDDITDGTNVEELGDVDFFTSGLPIDSLETLEQEIDE